MNLWSKPWQQGLMAMAPELQSSTMPLGKKIVGTDPLGRPTYLNEDGSISTERNVTVTDPRINQGMATNIPSIMFGQQMSPDQAAGMVANMGMLPGGIATDPMTGRMLGGYPSIDDAVQAELTRHRGFKLAPYFLDAYRPAWAR